MNLIYDSIKGKVPVSIRQDLAKTLDQGLEEQKQVKVFFRADDIGVQGHNFSRMMELFLKYGLPLCLAVVPTWVTYQRWELLEPFAQKGGNLFCWHQHGWRHCNHEIKGKKQEFGPSRPIEDILGDLEKGKKRLEDLLGHWFTPFFTPPWNRCTKETMESLVKLGFHGISRSYGNKPSPPCSLKEFSVHVDLHTRKEKSPAIGWEAFFNELAMGMETGVCGIMLHHMRMDESAFIFLEYFLRQIAGQVKIKPVTFKTLVSGGIHD